MSKKTLVIIILLLLASILWATQRHAITVAEQRAKVAQASYDSLSKIKQQLIVQYKTDTVTLRQWRTRWDSIVGPGRTDTLTVERVVYIADSTIRACEAVVQTCEQRVAVATEMADSAKSEANQWRKIAKGPWIRPAVELTVTSGWKPQAAGEVTLGRGALKALGRVDVSQGDQSCAFQPNTEAYACSATVGVTFRAGLRYSF